VHAVWIAPSASPHTLWGFSKQERLPSPLASFQQTLSEQSSYSTHSPLPSLETAPPYTLQHVPCNFSASRVLNSRQISYCQQALVRAGCGAVRFQLQRAYCFYRTFCIQEALKATWKQAFERGNVQIRAKENTWQGRKFAILCSMEFGNNFQHYFRLDMDVLSLFAVIWRP
jgi:hypothetical protein